MNHSAYYRTLVCTILWFLASLVSAQSPYVYRVLEYMPAPGQFVNLLPEYEEGDNTNMMRLKAEEYIADDARVLLSLGSWGGYVVFAFDHMVVNQPDRLDLQVLGNGFAAMNNPNPDAPANGGSSEPGIVMVSYDANGNGKADDAWYELAGADYFASGTRHNYTVTYYRPKPDHVPTPDADYRYLADTTYVPWRDSDGQTGYVMRNISHQQSYWPEWIDADSLVFTGTRLPDNYVDESGNRSYYVQYPYAYGYADNQANTASASKLNIDWAVAEDGTPVHLPGIHFVKVYTGVLQYCGWLGESSTEVMGALDLHLTGEDETDIFRPGTALNEIIDPSFTLLTTLVQDHLLCTADRQQTVYIVDMTGRVVLETTVKKGTTDINCRSLEQGLYLLRTAQAAYRFVKQ